MHTKLEVDVYGHWSDNPPDYRIYVNDEMMIERTFGWTSYQNYITEHMYCNLDTGVHTLRLENLDANSRFDLASFTVDKNPVNKNLLKTSTAINDTEKAIQSVSPAAPIERSRKVVQVKKYETYAPLVQRMRELNAKK